MMAHKIGNTTLTRRWLSSGTPIIVQGVGNLLIEEVDDELVV